VEDCQQLVYFDRGVLSLGEKVRITVGCAVDKVVNRREVQVRDRDYRVKRFGIIALNCLSWATSDVERLSK